MSEKRYEPGTDHVPSAGPYDLPKGTPVAPIPDAVLSAFIEAKGIAEARRALGWRGRLRRRLAMALRRLAAALDCGQEMKRPGDA